MIHYLTIVTIFTFWFSQLLDAKEIGVEKERAFYAISSLKFHLKETLSAENKDNGYKIVFADSDIAHLWSLALSNPSVHQRVQEAYDFYYTSLELIDPSSRTRHREKSCAILQAVWEELNP